MYLYLQQYLSIPVYISKFSLQPVTVCLAGLAKINLKAKASDLKGISKT